MSASQSSSVLEEVERRTESLVLEQGRHGYEEARRIFNSSIDRRPLAIVRFRRCQDIAPTVRLLNEAGLRFTVRGGGHSIAGTCIADGAVLLDFSLLRRVSFDQGTGIATAEAGALWCDYDTVTTRFGTASTGGIVSHTGVAGLTLGGGLGWLMGEAGLACDKLIGVTAVDAKAQVQHVGESDTSLRWFRGSGRSLGVVTHLHFRPIEMPAYVTAGRVSIDLAQAPQLLTACGRAAHESPDWLTVSPSIIWLDGQWRAVLDFVATQPVKATEAALADVFGAHNPQVRATSYVAAQRALDTELRFGRRNYWKSLAMPLIEEETTERLLLHLKKSPSQQTFLSVDVLHGKALQEPVGGSSFRLRGSPLVFLFNTIWEEAAADRANQEWCSEGFEILRSGTQSSHTYSNYFSDDDVGRFTGSEAVVDPDQVARWVPSGLM